MEFCNLLPEALSEKNAVVNQEVKVLDKVFIESDFVGAGYGGRI